jgi:hypothetical protein
LDAPLPYPQFIEAFDFTGHFRIHEFLSSSPPDT